MAAAALCVLAWWDVAAGQVPGELLFALDAASPTTRDATTGAVDCAGQALLARDVLAACGDGPPPRVEISGSNLGLSGAGAGADAIDALSRRWGAGDALFMLLFSTGRGALGGVAPLPGTYNLLDQGEKHQQAADVFLCTEAFERAAGKVGGLGEDNQVLAFNQGNALGRSLSLWPALAPHANWYTGTPAYLTQDHLAALTFSPPPGGPLYFSLRDGSVSLEPGQTGATVFVDATPDAPGGVGVYADAADLNLATGDDLDALIIFDANANNTFDAADQVLYSLTTDSPALAAFGAGPGDVLAVSPGGPTQVFAPASDLGLMGTDELDGLEILPIGSQEEVEGVVAALAVPSACCPSEVVISEIMYNPDSFEPGQAPFAVKTEWVELYNRGAAAVDLSGWWLQDEDGRTASLPANALIAPGAAVILAPGFVTAAEFHAAWGAAGVAVHPLAYWNGTDAEYPGNLKGLSNDPGPQNEVLTLRDAAGNIRDVVNYDDAFGWPSDSPDGPSIYLKPGRVDDAQNDLPASWARSVAGVHGADVNTTTAAFDGVDTGSPGVVVGAATNEPPLAYPQTALTDKHTPIGIFLYATDADGGQTPGDPLALHILSLPAFGTLTDENNGHVITAADLAGTGYYELSGGDQVIYTPDGATHAETGFAFRGHDTYGGGQVGNAATVTLLVQDTTVVITEIMFDPIRANLPGSGEEDDWEWVEVYNAGPQEVLLGELVDRTQQHAMNLAGLSIPSEAVRVIASLGRERTPRDFIDAWGGTATDFLFVPDLPSDANMDPDWPPLNNTDDDLYLRDAAGGLLDVVFYRTSGTWPTATEGSSIYLRGGSIDARSNDNPPDPLNPPGESNWLAAMPPADCATCIASGDRGSPRFVPGVTGAGNCRPCASGTSAITVTTQPVEVELHAVDDGQPAGALTYVVTRLPSLGALHDGRTPIAAAPHALGGDVVAYEWSGGTTGIDSFAFRADDTELSSSTAEVRVIVQNDVVVVTEILYHPTNAAPDESFWEYVEIWNRSDATVGLGSLTAGDYSNSNLFGTAIGPGQRKLIARDDFAGLRPRQGFLDEWGLAADEVLFAYGDPRAFPVLPNHPPAPGGVVRLFDAGGQLLDQVVYRAGADGWPADDGRSSIYVHGGALSAGGNDAAGAWFISRSGCDDAHPSSTADGVWDVGSPVDVASGTAAGTDCDANGENDACQVDADPSLDCNTNATPDACDLAAGESADCNGTGTPDACDVDAGASADVNGNGVPDECEGLSPCNTCEGDLNTDSRVDGADIGPFVAALLAGPPDPCADFDFDQDVDAADAAAFVERLARGVPGECG